MERNGTRVLRRAALFIGLLAATACTSPTDANRGRLTITDAKYFPRKAGSLTDSVVVFVKAEWHPGQFRMTVDGRQWTRPTVDVAFDGVGVLPVTLYRIGGTPFTLPDTIRAEAINFAPDTWIQR